MSNIKKLKFMDREYVIAQKARYLNELTEVLKKGNIVDDKKLMGLWDLYDVLKDSTVNNKPNVYDLETGLVISWYLLGVKANDPTIGRLYKSKTQLGHRFENGNTIEVMTNLSKRSLNADIRDYEKFKSDGLHSKPLSRSAGKFERIEVLRNSVVDFWKNTDFMNVFLDYVCMYYHDKLTETK